MTVISINIPDQLLARLDREVAARGYRSRSEFIREAIEDKLGGDQGEGPLAILVVSSHKDNPRVDEKIISAAYSVEGEELLGIYHSIVERDKCLTLVVVGTRQAGMSVARRIRGVRGVRKVLTVPL